ncbi:MAG: hypothetical protein DRI48_02770 [Chloroflexi bacterium]|nr:MAG: hypothetical protein DRI48_02770 [Chloroflexota bacterium]
MAERTQADANDKHLPSPACPDVLDPAALKNLRQLAAGDVGLLTQLIDTFLEDAPQLLAEIRRAVEDEDAPALHRAAHTLKSNSAEFGATALSDLCRELETMAQANALDEAADRLAQAESESEKATGALKVMRYSL